MDKMKKFIVETSARHVHVTQKDLETLRHTGSYLQGHPDMKKCPGIDISTVTGILMIGLTR